MKRPQILFLDAYDSFTNNIVSLLTTLLEADVHVLPIDTPLLNPESPTFSHEFHRELSRYHAVVCGPGPGSAEVAKDVGLMRWIWDLRDEHLLPVLGICLGFQSLVLSSGGRVRRLRRGLHGMVRTIQHEKPRPTCAEDVFRGVSEFKATLYHSLCADIGQDSVSDADWECRRWDAFGEAPALVPLAWVEEEREDGRERILMAVKHQAKPFWGLQYHPESVCTQPAGHAVIRNWLREAMEWNRKAGRTVHAEERFLARNAVKPSLLSEIRAAARGGGHAPVLAWTEMPTPLATIGLDCEYIYKTIALPANVKVPDIVEILKSGRTEHIILDSSNSSNAATGAADVRGRFSIIALDVEEALRIEHCVGNDFATAKIPSIQGLPVDLEETIAFGPRENIWHLLSSFVEKRRIPAAEVVETPFRGGFMGYLTYEMGLKGIDVSVAPDRGHRRPDLCFAWVTKSIVVDHIKGLLHVQHLQKRKLNADFWIDSVVASLQTSQSWQPGKAGGGQRVDPMTVATRPVIRVPDAGEYEAKVARCQDFIAAGESYELCLTDQTTITLPGRPSSTATATAATNGTPNGHATHKSAHVAPWKLYKTLRARQPAPFGSFIRLGGATLISSSPERFLEYDAQGSCSMRPMKGTVRKSNAVATLAQAEEILHVPKEEAENLMIVDLVRHDLHGVCGSGNVSVPHLMRVEEYATVFQMITVVDGRLPAAGGEDRYTGLDLLAASLPPGSMTGAPKKRSCELLLDVEGGRERSLYSGVVGYMDVTGRGDWSVTIRTMFRWDDEVAAPGAGEAEPREVWHIGAGGAVTILSTAEGEREEMFTKLAGPLGVFAEA